ncbi:Alpha-(1,3)-fucosyltransferase 11 [Mortierella sp. NVP41]|nr:Alpha-(1,3)-fucosyltransferase 11 [Mortierella sp. NVP41]
MSVNNPAAAAAAAAAAAPISTKEYPILWWTTWFWADEKEGWLIDKCGLPYNCRMTHNRAVYNEASTIVFHGSMFHKNLKDLPPLEDAQSDIVETYFGSGRTGNLSYLKNGEDFTSFEIVSRYKFYLLERPFEAGIVPIVDGPHDYSPFITTPDSVINMDAFNGSPKGLAEYIHMLDQDDETYLQLLRYKFPGNVTVAQTLDHLSPSLRSYYDTGDNHSDWGVDGRGATCKMCKLTHDLAEGIVHLVPSGPTGSNIRTPTVGYKTVQMFSTTVLHYLLLNNGMNNQIFLDLGKLVCHCYVY